MNSITNRQLFFILFLTLTSYSTIDLPQHMAQTAGRSSWIPIIIMAVIFGVAVVMIAKLNNMHQGKMFFDYSGEIAGKFLSYVFACYFVLYFLFIGVGLKLKMAGMIKADFLPKTPEFVFILFSIILFGFVAYKGISNLARLFELYGIMFLVITIGLCILMLIEGMPYNILPFFSMTDVPKFLEASKQLVFSFGGIEMLFIIPFTAMNKKAPKIVFFTLLLIGFIFILVVEGTLMIMGINNTAAMNDAFIEGIKVIEVPVLERADIFYLTFGLTSLFAGMTIVYTAVVEFLCKLFSKIKRFIIVIAVGTIFFVLSWVASSIKNSVELYESLAVYFIIISDLLIPALLFIWAKIKKSATQSAKSKTEGISS